MKKDKLKDAAIKAIKDANITQPEWAQIHALKAIAWAIIYLADALRYRLP